MANIPSHMKVQDDFVRASPDRANSIGSLVLLGLTIGLILAATALLGGLFG